MEGTAQYAWNMWRITEAATEKRISMVIQGRIRSHSNEILIVSRCHALQLRFNTD
jgi:hypothetical protein